MSSIALMEKLLRAENYDEKNVNSPVKHPEGG
jgi:hypothetical protein